MMSPLACSQTLGAATEYSPQLATGVFPPDGLMGLAFQSISEYNAPPTFQNLVSQGEVREPIFSFKLAPDGSELFLGGANPELYKGYFTWVDLTTKGYWQVPFDSISVYGIPAVEKTEAIYDTGTTLILGDPVGIQSLYDEILGSFPATKYGDGFYTIPCEFDTPIVITVGGKPVNISPDSFNFGHDAEEGPDRCLGGAASTTELPDNLWILGDGFFRNVYTSWDVDKGRIGFANLC